MKKKDLKIYSMGKIFTFNYFKINANKAIFLASLTFKYDFTPMPFS